ncbi:MAG: DUF3822 family protein [Culturomica sp.]|jgi:hypothetical protein|nr:DUF3822 family protein [Culturomica sp.]
MTFFYSNSEFKKENTVVYILSIRFATDGLSFSIHDADGTLMVFSFKPHMLTSQDEVIAKTKKTLVEDELLNLQYKKVYVLPANKDKMLIPAHIFNKDLLPDIYRVCLPTDKNDTLLYKKIRPMEAYIVESQPRNFVKFLTSRYRSLCIVNSAYPFIINSLSDTGETSQHLFIDIHDTYFDLLIVKERNVLLFNSFNYSAIPDMVYFILLSLRKCGIETYNLYTSISGNLVDDPMLLKVLSSYLLNITLLKDDNLNVLLKNDNVNSSAFIHLLSMHKCE